MFAKNLESLLTELCQKGDVSYASNKEIATRFDALRGFGQLPRGRVHRATPLTNAQIAAAIFGLASELPNWAGHAAVILSKLQPVGGPDASFYGTASLQNAVEKILCDNDARKSVINLSVSVSESAINSNGFATLSYDDNGTRSRAFFVPRQALSLLQQGAETHFDAERRYAEVSRQISFSRKFFNRIAQAVQRARSLPCLPAGDGSEYDAEEAQAERYRKLRVNGRSNFLSIGVDNQVTWPMEETVVEFDRYHLVLMPKTRDHVQSVHIDLHANRLSDLDAMTVVNRFLSMMTWCDDQYAVAQGGTSGSPVPIPVTKRDLAFTTAYRWAFCRQIPSSEANKRALALYREARVAQQNFLISFAVLNYYKIIEIRYPSGEKARKWIASVFPMIKNNVSYGEEVNRLLEASGEQPPERYIYSACRVAVAHASERHPSDPDHAEEIRRLHVAADVMRILARHFIEHELKISDSMYSGQ